MRNVKKILITGCARSGTTLLMYLFKYMKRVNVVTNLEAMPTKLKYKGHGYFKLVEDENRKSEVRVDEGQILAIKRPRHELNSALYEPLEDILSIGFKVVFLIRDGRDVCVSRHPPEHKLYHVDPPRWIGTTEEAIKYNSHKNILFVKYEDLVLKSDEVLHGIADFIGTKIKKGYFDFFNEINPVPRMYGGFGVKGIRKISGDSIGNWRLSEHRERLINIIGSPEINKFSELLVLLGYEKDKNWIYEFLNTR